MRRVWGLALFCVGAGLFIALIFPKSFLMLVVASCVSWQGIIYFAADRWQLPACGRRAVFRECNFP